MPTTIEATKKTDPLRQLSGKLEGYECLVVDDARDIQLLLKTYLQKMGCKVSIASDGREAILAAEKYEYDFIIMDKQMPKMNGIAATRQIRKAGYTGPILALTADALSEDIVEFERAGCDAYLTKPIDIKKLSKQLVAFMQ